jgi:hypothetical protein
MRGALADWLESEDARFEIEDTHSWIVPRGASRPLLRCLPPRSEAPGPPADLLRAIEASRRILNLPDDWDDEGSPRIQETTWKRATDYLRRHAELVHFRYGSRVPIPRILPGPAGSVDLHWKTGSRELLVNVPANADEPAAFYGDGFGTNSIKGQLKTEADDPGLFTWLIAMD